jgi:AcrR family transcriptional regulator
MPPDEPLTLDRILATAEEVVRRFGPGKATVVDVARAMGVSHAAVYRHVASKAQLRDLVVERWIDRTMPPLRAIAAGTGPAPERLRAFIDALVTLKRRRAADDPELFTAYRTLAAGAMTVIRAHLKELIDLLAGIIADGVASGTLSADDPVAAGRAVLLATNWFHNPAHATMWNEPGIDAALDDVWQIIMRGLAVRADG